MTETAREAVERLVPDPICVCHEYWPGQGHPPDCPRSQCEALIARLDTAEAERDRAQAWIREHAYVEYETGQVMCRECHNPFGPIASHAPGCYVAELEGHDD